MGLPEDPKDLARELIRQPDYLLKVVRVLAENRDFCLPRLAEVQMEMDVRLGVSSFLTKLGVVISNPGRAFLK